MRLPALRVLARRSLSTAAMASPITVTVPDVPENKPYTTRPPHHDNDTASLFRNPWKSFNGIGPAALAKGFWQYKAPKVLPETFPDALKVQKPSWNNLTEDLTKIKSTWMGHASFLLELPAPRGASRGARILFDPVFGERCSPFTFAGPKRYTAAPCQVDDLPAIDIVCISHNHYDHMDETTLRQLIGKQSPTFITTLGNDTHLTGFSAPQERIQTLDWWQSRTITVDLPSTDSTTVKTTFHITATPAQHQSNRGLFDRMKTLWAGFAITSVDHASAPGGPVHTESDVKPFSIYFSGDTGYRYVADGTNEEDAERCPAFKEIGEKFGGFDLAYLPIGAYLPREFMSNVHASPSDSVCIFQDIRAKRAVGMHWGTWVLTSEEVTVPPELLRKECEKAGIPAGLFDVIGLGQTVTF